MEGSPRRSPRKAAQALRGTEFSTGPMKTLITTSTAPSTLPAKRLQSSTSPTGKDSPIQMPSIPARLNSAGVQLCEGFKDAHGLYLTPIQIEDLVRSVRDAGNPHWTPAKAKAWFKRRADRDLHTTTIPKTPAAVPPLVHCFRVHLPPPTASANTKVSSEPVIKPRTMNHEGKEILQRFVRKHGSSPTTAQRVDLVSKVVKAGNEHWTSKHLKEWFKAQRKKTRRIHNGVPPVTGAFSTSTGPNPQVHSDGRRGTPDSNIPDGDSAGSPALTRTQISILRTLAGAGPKPPPEYLIAAWAGALSATVDLVKEWLAEHGAQLSASPVTPSTDVEMIDGTADEVGEEGEEEEEVEVVEYDNDGNEGGSDKERIWSESPPQDSQPHSEVSPQPLNHSPAQPPDLPNGDVTTLRYTPKPEPPRIPSPNEPSAPSHNTSLPEESRSAPESDSSSLPPSNGLVKLQADDIGAGALPHEVLTEYSKPTRDQVLTAILDGVLEAASSPVLNNKNVSAPRSKAEFDAIWNMLIPRLERLEKLITSA